MEPSPPSSRLPRWATGAGLLVLDDRRRAVAVAGPWGGALHKPAARERPRCSGPTRGWQSTLRRHARRGARPCSRWRGRRGPDACASAEFYNAPNPTQRVGTVVAGGLRTFANANAHRSLFWHGLRALGGSVEAIFVVSKAGPVGTPTAATSCVARTTRTARKYETRSLRLIPSTSRSTRTPTVRTRRSPAGSRAAPPVTQTPEYPRRTPGSRRTGSPRHSTSCAVWKSKFYDSFVLNLHAIDATPAR